MNIIHFIKLNVIFIKSKQNDFYVFYSGGSTMPWQHITTSSWTTTTTYSAGPGIHVLCMNHHHHQHHPHHHYHHDAQQRAIHSSTDAISLNLYTCDQILTLSLASGGFGFSGILRGTSLFSCLVTTAFPCPGPTCSLLSNKIFAFHINPSFTITHNSLKSVKNRDGRRWLWSKTRRCR